MDIANKKRTYVWWNTPLIFMGKETTRHLCFEFSLSLYN